MTINISNKLKKILADTHKNPDYSLRCFIDGIDSECCSDLIKAMDSYDLGKTEATIEISDSTIEDINSLFGNANRETIELLVWISVFLPEI